MVPPIFTNDPVCPGLENDSMKTNRIFYVSAAAWLLLLLYGPVSTILAERDLLPRNVTWLTPASARAQAAEPIIIDHTCTDIWEIPESAINQAKTSLHIAYAHTSHGSQLTSGMGSSNGAQLDDFMSDNGASPDLYLWNNGGNDGALDLHNYFVAGDLGNPDRTTWAQRTRDYLDDPANSDVNVIIWSWCGQASTSIENIDIYLNLMEDLIADYPNVDFVFMTGHLNGGGASGQLNLANEHIRSHCETNNRILYDFADIESYDPDALVNYMELIGDDECDYDSDGNGSRDRNWAREWQTSHTLGVDWWESGAAHSEDLNGNMKGYAAWWLWARLSGWAGPLVTADFEADTVAGAAPLVARFTDLSTGSPTSWEWSFGDGQTSEQRHPGHTYTSPGTYSVSLTAANAYDDSVETKPAYIDVGTCSNQPVRIEGGSMYSNVSSAYIAAINQDNILIQAVDFTGGLDFDEDKLIHLTGGHGCDYSGNPPGMALVGESVEISNGAIVLADGCVGIGN